MRTKGAKDWSIIQCHNCDGAVNRVNAISIDGDLYGCVCGRHVIYNKEKNAREQRRVLFAGSEEANRS